MDKEVKMIEFILLFWISWPGSAPLNEPRMRKSLKLKLDKAQSAQNRVAPYASYIKSQRLIPF